MIHLWGALRCRAVLALLANELTYQGVRSGCCAPGS